MQGLPYLPQRRTHTASITQTQSRLISKIDSLVEVAGELLAGRDRVTRYAAQARIDSVILLYVDIAMQLLRASQHLHAVARTPEEHRIVERNMALAELTAWHIIEVTYIRERR